MVTAPPSPVPAVPALRDAADRAVDGLLGCVVDTGDGLGWPSWQLDPDGWPLRLTGGGVTLYEGDAGIAWALAMLGVALDRIDAAELAVRGIATALRAPTPLAPGLLDGRVGVVLAAHRVQEVTGLAVPGLDGAVLPPPEAFDMAELTAGLAGLGLAQARLGCSRREAARTVAGLRRAALPAPVGLCWADPGPAGPRPLCGLSHGASGIALAAAELAALHSGLPGAAEVVAGAVRWESTWFDPLAGGWPDLREDAGGHPALWCHGAAGIAAVRLRLLELADRGVELGLPVEQLEVDAEVAVQACGRHLAAVGEALVSTGAHPSAASAPPGGLTLCHGLGGPIDVLVEAHRRWGVARHLDLAREVALAVLERVGHDPLGWPSGLREVDSAGLMVGTAGTALVLTRAADPGGPIASPSLLCG